jgi:hypothetical protein
VTERDQEPQEDQDSKQNAAKGEEAKQEPEQDGTADSLFDTDQHSDAPGPFGTG